MKTKSWITAALSVTCHVALGCGSGGGGGAGGTCETPDGRLSSGAYVVTNDTSPNAALPAEEQVTEYSMCARRAPGSRFSLSAYWEWSWPAVSTVRTRATPSVVFGFHPSSAASTTPDLPALVSEVGSLRVDAGVSQQVGSSQISDFGVVVYLTTSDQKTGTDPLPIAKQLRVLRNRYRAPTVTPTATSISLSGLSWDVVVTEDEVMYYPHAEAGAPVDALHLELRGFLADALARDAVEPTWFVASVETGAIVSQGTGNLALTDYEVRFSATQ